MHDMKEELGNICWSCMYREVASHFEGDIGAALFDYYDCINHTFFSQALPQAFLLTALTAYGGCIGQTKADISHKPIILIHPTLKTEQERFYTVLHECIHVHVRYNLRRGQSDGSKTSHSTPEWIAEVNRIAEQLGYGNVTIGENKVTRVKDGTPKGTLKRIASGNVSYACSTNFPQHLEKETGQHLPSFEHWLSLYRE